MSDAVYAEDVQSGSLNQYRTIKDGAVVRDTMVFGFEKAVLEFVSSDAHSAAADMTAFELDRIESWSPNAFCDVQYSLHSHDGKTPGIFLSPKRSSCVHNLTQRKENLATDAPENLSLGSCSLCRNETVCTRSCTYATNNFSFISNSEFVAATPGECAATTSPAPLIPVVAASIQGAST